MPFSSTASLTSTDMNNTLRGLYRDNADHALTGTVSETDLASTSITANTMGATGCLHIIAAGTITGAAGNKTIALKFGSTTLSTFGPAAGTADWYIDMWIFNTATNAQRVTFVRGEFSGASTQDQDYITAAIDTTANQTLKLTGTLSNSADTITQSIFNVFVCQIT